jgi:N,N'-diacetyllegionaminate synthase
MKTFIIAEAGVNHNGDAEIGKRMIEAAANARASCVKFQSFTAEKLASRFADKAEYQKQNSANGGESQLAMLKQLEMDRKMHEALMACARDFGIEFLSTPFDLDSISMLDELGVKRWKIPSGEITNLPYLRKISESGKPAILSTGMSALAEVQDAIDVLQSKGNHDIVVLQCNTQYPTPFRDANLKAMLTMKEAFGLPVGYSDHTLGIEVPIAAVAMGAVVIEKHFTLDRAMQGPDHKASLIPEELRQMVQMIRNVEEGMGDGDKRPSLSETPNIAVARKSIVAAKHIQKGEIFTEGNIAAKRPGDGISPMLWDDILGRAAKRNFEADEMIRI